MAKFCSECGTKLDEGVKFCPGCGTPVGGAAASVPAPPPAAPTPRPPRAPIPFDIEPPKSKALPIALGVLAVAVLAVVGFLFFYPKDEDATDPELAQVEETPAAEDPNADRPQEWFDNYSDKFLSAELTRLTQGEARKRSFPTAKGGEILDTLSAGRAVTGRWVEGADPETRWLKTTDGGYIWEGNLTALETITSAGMMGLLVDARMPTLREKVDPVGVMAAQLDDWDTEACDIHRSNDGLFDVMMEEGKATAFTTDSPRLATARGIKVGSSEAELRKAYGNKLKSEPNPYDGTDYFVWDSKERGIKFHVASDGKVEFISAGGPSIRYVEGCL